MVRSKLSQQFRSLLVPSAQRDCRLDSFSSLLLSINSFSTASQKGSHTSTPNLNSKNPLLADYLTNSFKFPQNEAIAVSNRFPSIDSIEKPEAVVRYLKSLGLSVTQLQSLIKHRAHILFADIEKTLKPKVTFYQELGVDGTQLRNLISKNSAFLASSLEKRLKPSIGVIKKVQEFGFFSFTEVKRSCGIVGSQLIMLLKTQLRIFSLCDTELKHLVTRATEMGFVMGSRMLVYGIVALNSNSLETFNRKLKLLQGFGFTTDECRKMFVNAPFLFKKSEANLRGGIQFLIDTLMLDKSVLVVDTPSLLLLSMEKRLIPRYKIQSRRVLFLCYAYQIRSS